MRSWQSADIYRPITRNVIFYDGPSMLTGDRILGVATAQNGNRKIGHMLQLWIIPAISPIVAVQSGKDDAVCGDCKMRGDRGKQRTCYVEYFRAVENIWQSAQRVDRTARLAPPDFADLVTGLQLRIGAYGDPVAVPLSVWLPMLTIAAGFTAYSHQWRRPDAQPYRTFCMASVDSSDEQRAAADLGWRTFRVRASADDVLHQDELACPASDEGGHRAVCAACTLCRGQSRPAKHVAIIAHGTGMKWFPSAAAALQQEEEGALA